AAPPTLNETPPPPERQERRDRATDRVPPAADGRDEQAADSAWREACLAFFAEETAAIPDPAVGITAPLKDESPDPAPALDVTTAVAGAVAALGGMVAVPEYRDDPRGRRRSRLDVGEV